jgi:mRNA-degrading endonuclease RelE of RelBE toxin-antitoxin system
MLCIGLRELRLKMKEYIERVLSGEKIAVKQNRRTVFIMIPPDPKEEWKYVDHAGTPYDTLVQNAIMRLQTNNVVATRIEQNTHSKSVFRIRRGNTRITIQILSAETTISV